jgi:SulP family sulfate permease
LVDLTVAIGVGVTLALLLFMMRMSKTVEIANDNGDLALAHEEEGEDIHQRDALPAGVEVFRIDGPVFFGVANELLDTLRRIGGALEVIVLRMRRVPLLDASGVTAIEEIVRQEASGGTQIILSGVQPQPLAMLERVSLGLGSRRVIHSQDFPEALRTAAAIKGARSK